MASPQQDVKFLSAALKRVSKQLSAERTKNAKLVKENAALKEQIELLKDLVAKIVDE